MIFCNEICSEKSYNQTSNTDERDTENIAGKLKIHTDRLTEMAINLNQEKTDPMIYNFAKQCVALL